MDLKAELLAATEEFCARKRMSKARLATIVVNDGKFFSRLDGGGTFTIPTYEKFMAYFAEHAADDAVPAGDHTDTETPPSQSGRAA